VITNEPKAMIKACIGLSFGFLIGKLGRVEYVRQNAIALRMLNPGVHKSIVSTALWYALRRSGMVLDRTSYDTIIEEVYLITEAPLMNSNFVNFRRTWFSRDCAYNTVAKVTGMENANKIDSDREYMTIDTKYITNEVAEFTGFSRSRIDKYWREKDWTKKLRTLYTLEEALETLYKEGISDPTRKQLSEKSGLSIGTISRDMADIKKMIEYNKTLPESDNDNMTDEK
jgi:hypothetical protein